jgi:glycopeptide antibiotics resistance protein
MKTLRRLPLWAWWVPVVWIVSLPIGLTTKPQWSRVHAVPFSDPADKPADLIVNVALFVPFGYSLRRSSGRFGVALLGAAITSISAEMLQLFSTIRYPSGTDVASGVAGAAVGAFIAGRRHATRTDTGHATSCPSPPSN